MICFQNLRCHSEHNTVHGDGTVASILPILRDMCLSKLSYFVQIAKNLSKLQNIFVKVEKYIFPKISVGEDFMGWEQQHKVCPYCGKCGRGEKLMW